MISVVAGSERNLYLYLGVFVPFVGLAEMVEVGLVSALHSLWALVQTDRAGTPMAPREPTLIGAIACLSISVSG
jgi:hypothetical protein